MTQDKDQMRAEFEAWASKQEGYGTAGNTPDYRLGAVREAWKVWQAARAMRGPIHKQTIKLIAQETGLATEGVGDALVTAWLEHVDLTDHLVDFAREIEGHHGIGGKA